MLASNQCTKEGLYWINATIKVVAIENKVKSTPHHNGPLLLLLIPNTYLLPLREAKREHP